MNIIKNIIYGKKNPAAQVLDIYLPQREEADLLIYFHGGGLESGDKEADFLKDLQAHGKAVISANYRMYPDAAFPDFIEDAALVVKWANDQIGNYIKINKFFISGSSAGAYLTSMLAYDSRYLWKYHIKTTDITGYIIDSAPKTVHPHVLRERGLDSRRILVDEAAPVYFINEGTEFPNVFIIVSDDDMPGRLEQNLMFLKTLELFQCPPAKVTYRLMKGYTHCGYTGNAEFVAMVSDYMDSTC